MQTAKMTASAFVHFAPIARAARRYRQNVPSTAVQESTSQTAAPAASARYIGEDGIEVVPYVPVESPAAAAPVHREAQREAPPAAAQQSAPAAKPAKAPKKGIAKALPFIIIGAVVLLGALIGVVALVYAVLESHLFYSL